MRQRAERVIEHRSHHLAVIRSASLRPGMNGGAMGTILPGRADSVTWVFTAFAAPISHRE
jgi:hypothetical protein